MLGIIKKKKTIGLIIIIIAASVIYYQYSQEEEVKASYQVNQVEQGTIIDYIAGTGQVSSYNQGAISSSISGEIIRLSISPGDEVSAGQIVAVIDSTELQAKISEAEDALETARLNLEKVKRGMKEEELELALIGINNKENDIRTAEEDLEKARKEAEDNLKSAQDKALSEIDKTYNTFINTIRTSMNDCVDLTYFITNLQYSYFNDNTQEGTKISSAKSSIVSDLFGIQNGGRASINEIDKSNGGLRKEVATLVERKDKDSADRIYLELKSAMNRLKEVINIIPLNDSLTSSEKNDIISKKVAIDNKVIALGDARKSILDQIKTNEDNLKDVQKRNQESIESAMEKVENAKSSLLDSRKQLEIKQIIDPYDIESQEMNIRQKENALAEAKKKLNDCYIKAPFSGIVASVEIAKGDNVSSNTSIGTIITKKQIAEISLNEIDIANIKVGQKATLTFDAIEGLTITGNVIEVGLLGNTSQGVVSYPVKIILEDEDSRIKAGMSTSVNILIDFKQNVLMLPVSAIRTVGSTSYVNIPKDIHEGSTTYTINSDEEIEQIVIETGKLSNNYIEITSGLKEGDVVVTKISASRSTTTSNNSQQGLFQFGGGSMPRNMR